jgi:hypothetical protein
MWFMAGMSAIHAPVPIAWSAERDARGASSAPRTPRCTEPSCIVRYASGADRPCRWHTDDDKPSPRRWRGTPGLDDDDLDLDLDHPRSLTPVKEVHR